MVTKREDIIKIISAECETRPGVQLCILYGSAASDNLVSSSDIDIVVGSEAGPNVEYCIDLSISLSLKTGREVSVIDIAKIERLILEEVLTKGIRLKNSNPNYLAHYIIKMYEYTEDIFPHQLSGSKKRIEEFLRG